MKVVKELYRREIHKKRLVFVLIILMVALITDVYIYHCAKKPVRDFVEVHMSTKAEAKQEYQVYYSNDGVWSEEKSSKVMYDTPKKEKEMCFISDCYAKKIRFDFGNSKGTQDLSNIYILYKGRKWNIDSKKFNVDNSNNVKNLSQNSYGVTLTADGEDPYCIVDVSEMDIANQVISIRHKTVVAKYIMLAVLFNVVCLILLLYSNRCIELMKEIYFNRRLIYNLAKNDFKTKYADSFFGIFWAFVQPMVTVVLYWFVFQVGFRSGSVNGNIPFVVWLITGLVPWFFFNDALVNGSNCLIDYSYLVKKVVFKISVLPIVKVISALFVHLFFIALAIAIVLLNGISPSLTMIQVVYYTGCMFAIALALSYSMSAIIVFFRDLSQIITIALQIGMWITPILWNYNIMPEKYRWLLKINPIYYVVEGYRESLLYHHYFWENMSLTVYFWLVTLALAGIGFAIFRKLRPHFADVL